MAEFAVQEALGTAEKVIIELYKLFKCPNMLHADVEKAQTFLEMVHACLIDSDDFIDEGSQLIRSCVDLARSIENVLDELMLQLVSDDVQTNRSSHNSDDQVSDDVQTNEESYQNSDDEDAKSIEDWAAGNEFSTNINKILDDNIDFVKNLLDSLQKDISKGGSRSRLGDGLTWSYGDLATDDDVLGFEEHKEKLLTELAEEDSKLSTVLIVGPGGSGKSTLVKSVFESDQVQGSFEFKRWVPVPRGPFQLKQLLLKMLPADSENTPAASEDIIDPKAKLRHLLQERRYMIVLDDVWRSEDLQSIMKVLPNNFHGSRIIITTRNSDVAFFLSPKYSHDLSCGLSWEKANELLIKKAIEDGIHWKELVPSTDEVLRWSGSLPYAIIAEVGTMLAMKPQTAPEWMEEIRPGSSLSIISSVLQPSYVDLPNHLKTCFLYLSAFPVDCCIEAEMLIPLWVAEGFVKPKRGTTEEQVAEEYLNELIARSLVIATEREIYGKVRSCRVLTHVRDFILSKPENFINVFHPNNPTDGTPAGEHIRRLSIHQAHPSDNSFLEKLIARDDLKHIRTLLVFTKSGCFIGLDKLVEANKYLRVLDLSKVVYIYGNRNLNLNYFPKSVLLKYLSLQGFKVGNVPETIRKLKFLETLNLQSTKVTALPKEICQLSSLRHLLVSNDWGGGVKLSEPSIGILSSIQSLSLINVENDAITIKGLGELQQLRKLKLVGLGKKDGKQLCIGLEKMKHLSTLVVKAKYGELLDLDHISSPPLYLQHLLLRGRLQRLPNWISKFTSLQMVELRWSGLDNDPTELLQDLPNLISLNLVGYYTGEELVFRAHTFKKLLKLSITYFHKLNKMEFADGALPMLRELNIITCSDLKSFPKGIGDLKSLNKLVLDVMLDVFVAMFRKGSRHRHLVRHIPVILYKEEGILIEDLSENVSSTLNIQEGRSGGQGGNTVKTKGYGDIIRGPQGKAVGDLKIFWDEIIHQKGKTVRGDEMTSQDIFGKGPIDERSLQDILGRGHQKTSDEKTSQDRYTRQRKAENENQ